MVSPIIKVHDYGEPNNKSPWLKGPSPVERRSGGGKRDAILSSSLVPSVSVRIRSSLYWELRHWFTAELESYLRTERLLIWIVEDRKMTESSLDLQESGWEELRREARKIEGDLDVKLSSYAKLGARFTQGGSFFFLSAWSCYLCLSLLFPLLWMLLLCLLSECGG